MTRCCPIEAIARIATNGSMVRIAPAETVLGARIPPTIRRSATARAALAACDWPFRTRLEMIRVAPRRARCLSDATITDDPVLPPGLSQSASACLLRKHLLLLVLR